ncbi:hypothetical protein GGI07_000083 [Coemansia sp. Benny D115]|nr:hypothetical protein GGI07_000083 [Coemansia sp. Benny D115]
MENGTSTKQLPSHPFTMDDVEVMRTMRIRIIRRKYTLLLSFQALISLLILLWIAYTIATYTSATSARFSSMSDWVILISMLMIVASTAGIFLTAKKYRSSIKFLQDPATHPDLIINSEMSSYETYKTTALPFKKTNC